MNSKLKGVIAGGVVLCCLGATLALLEFTGKPDQGSSSSSIDTSIVEDEKLYPLTSLTKESISKITFSNEHGELHIVRSGTSQQPSWSVQELDGIKQNGTAVSACLNICSSLSGKELVEENAADLAKYGLAQPSATITISSDSAADTTFLIGDEIPTGNYRYIVQQGSHTVYTVLINNINYFLQNEQYFCGLSLVYTPSDDAWPTIDRLTIKRKDLDYDMVFVTLDPENTPIGFVSTQAMI